MGHLLFFCSVEVLVQSPGDHSLFINQTGMSFTAVLVYVDNILIASNDDEAVLRLKKTLHQAFKIKGLGQALSLIHI